MEQTIITNDISKAEDPLDHEASEDEAEGNPYSGRVIGVHKKTQEALKKKPSTSKKKCQKCGKGFNCNSKYYICHLCDKLQHVDCSLNVTEKETFTCSKCNPSQKPSTNVTKKTSVTEIVVKPVSKDPKEHHNTLLAHIREHNLPYKFSSRTRFAIMILALYVSLFSSSLIFS